MYLTQEQADSLLLYIILLNARYGKEGVLRIEKWRDALIGMPHQPLIYALAVGDDIEIHVHPAGDGSTITPDDLEEIEQDVIANLPDGGGKGTVH